MNLNKHKLKEVIKTWKEIRKNEYPRRIIIYHYTKWNLRLMKWYCFHLWYKLTKYEHIHIWHSLFKCLICRKTKMDIDYEHFTKGKENERNK